MSKLCSVAFAWLAAAILALSASAAGADTLAKPTGRVILEISGAIANTNAEGKAKFDRSTLEGMATTELSTSTPWTKGVQRFQGFPLADLLRLVGSSGTRIKAVALNDYSAVLPIEDSVNSGAFLAVRANGQPMSVRERGPLWIVFPYDSDPRLTTDAYLNRSVWQIKELLID